VLMKVPLRLIHLPNWATSRMLWGYCENVGNSTIYRIFQISDNPDEIPNGGIVGNDVVGSVVLYFCDHCGRQLDVIFQSWCNCGAVYEGSVYNEMNQALVTLNCRLPPEIVAAHSNSACLTHPDLFVWKAPDEREKQPSFVFEQFPA
jgi:hypothetical protein